MQQSQLRALEDQCIQECAPTCSAACPIHVDVRSVMLEAAQGHFGAALKVLQKTLPFPGIVGRVCTHPCQAICKRMEAGESISIAALEQACAEYGAPAEKPRVLPRRGKRVAIAGAGLSGLTAAYDLARKGYEVVLFEAGDRLGGSLWNVPEPVVPRQVLRSETALVETVGAQVRLNTAVHTADLAQLGAEFGAVYLATGSGGEPFGLALDAQGHIQVDPVSFGTSQAGMFAGGGLLRDAGECSVIHSISDGRRAATSIDRYLQQVSLTASRTNEGAYTTRLYTNTVGSPALPAVPMADPAQGYTRAEATREAQRCLQCECMECVKVCEYLKHYGRYPRKYVREIYNNLSIVKGERKTNQFINSCSLCGLCGEVCPEGLNMGEVNLAARQMMVAQNRMPPSAHDFALRDMQFSNSEQFALARNPPGAATSDAIFFPGCQLGGSSPEYVGKVYGYLQDTLGDVGLMLRCCGAPALWASRTDLFESSLAELRNQHKALGSPKLILACSTCYQTFKVHLPELEIVSLWDVMDRHGLPPEAHATIRDREPEVVAVHDPCTTRHERHIHASVRNILNRLGYTVDELPLSRENTECCSYGGLMWLANPELARATAQRRISASPADYVTYCAMCRDFFAARGKRTLHLLDLLYAPDVEARAARPSPGYSQRHENKARLKRQLLRERWGEAMSEPFSHEKIQLLISAEVQERLEQRLILAEDIQRVIEYAEKSGRKLRNPQTGHWLAHYKPNAVTYWVEYAAQGEAFAIYNAYSHRMVIVEDGQA
jgi:NADPH-dependent glutamate synthase beta subunit-like oxidoreductase